MKKLLVIVCALAFVASLLFTQLNATFWLAPPEKKFALAIAEDLKLLEQKHFLPEGWQKIQSIALTSDASHVSNWLKKNSFEIKQKPTGDFILEIFVSEWIDGYRYGALVEYDLVDSKNKNTVWELNRTYKLGFIY